MMVSSCVCALHKFCSLYGTRYLLMISGGVYQRSLPSVIVMKTTESVLYLAQYMRLILTTMWNLPLGLF